MAESSRETATLAVFDFDDTLIKGDSLWAFFFFVVGVVPVFAGIVEALAAFGWVRMTNPRHPDLADLRTFIKARLITTLLAGKTLDRVAPAIERLARWQTWNEAMRRELLDHAASGHHIVIASGALDIYLPMLVKDLPHDALICTCIGVENGAITGQMVSGNCVRRRKAEMVGAYIAEHGPFTEGWGYGNYPHDMPMLGLVRHRVLV